MSGFFMLNTIFFRYSLLKKCCENMIPRRLNYPRNMVII